MRMEGFLQINQMAWRNAINNFIKYKRAKKDLSKYQKKLLKNRKKLWVNGGIKDIKIGNYYVFRMFEKLKFSGLENNVALKNGNKHILICDNHNFAAAYIIEMYNNEVIGKNSKCCILTSMRT